MAAYSMIEPNAVYIQEDGKNELDVMFSVARMTPEEMWRIRLGESCDFWRVSPSVVLVVSERFHNRSAAG
jgi:hypothetical protein